ncbi:MAG: hypothetical protein Q9M31_00555 [Mariprofundus sp.]|nr:hypothetical protein [Mariprofundus sp.]
MSKFIVYVLLVLVLVAFASQNLGLVATSWMFGPPIILPLITVMFICFMLGFVAAIFLVVRKAAKKNNER